MGKSRIIGDADGPVWGAFALSYASYFVMPRIVLMSMPAEWQERFVDLVNELHERIEYDEPPRGYAVLARDTNGRFYADPYMHYRHATLLAAKEPPPDGSLERGDGG